VGGGRVRQFGRHQAQGLHPFGRLAATEKEVGGRVLLRLNRGPCAPKLVHHGQADCVELTDDLLDQVVERIVGWYDAVEAVLIG